MTQIGRPAILRPRVYELFREGKTNNEIMEIIQKERGKLPYMSTILRYKKDFEMEKRLKVLETENK